MQLDNLLEKIIETAKREAPNAHACQQALLRAGDIARVYVDADPEVIEDVFRLTA